MIEGSSSNSPAEDLPQSAEWDPEEDDDSRALAAMFAAAAERQGPPTFADYECHVREFSSSKRVCFTSHFIRTFPRFVESIKNYFAGNSTATSVVITHRIRMPVLIGRTGETSVWVTRSTLQRATFEQQINSLIEGDFKRAFRDDYEDYANGVAEGIDTSICTFVHDVFY
jgi:hypothetical protein